MFFEVEENLYLNVNKIISMKVAKQMSGDFGVVIKHESNGGSNAVKTVYFNTEEEAKDLVGRIIFFTR